MLSILAMDWRLAIDTNKLLGFDEVAFVPVRSLGVWTFIPFGVVLAGCFVFTMCYLPETLNRTVDEIQQLIHGPDVQVRTRHNIKHKNMKTKNIKL